MQCEIFHNSTHIKYRITSDISLAFTHERTMNNILFVYVIARAGVKFGINFTSCSVNGNFAVIAIDNEWNLSQNFTPACAITN